MMKRDERRAAMTAFIASTACAEPWCAECYREWQEAEELREAADQAAYARRAIERGDPECEAAIEVLEQGW